MCTSGAIQKKLRLAMTRGGAIRFSLIEGYSRSLLMRSSSEEDSLVAIDLVQTITANIESFLKGRPHKLEIDIDRPKEEFLRFIEAIGAKGDIESALGEFSVRHDVNKAFGDNTLRPSQVLSENKDAPEEGSEHGGIGLSPKFETNETLRGDPTMRRKAG
jgi:hypothetical protein